MKKFYQKIENAFFEKDYKSWQVFLIYLIISLAVFSPSFLNLNYFWDDEKFIFLNPDVIHASDYLLFWNPNSISFKSWPLGYTIFSLLVKHSPFQSFEFYKFLNIFFHAFNGFLIFRISEKMNIKYSFFLALIFLIHPLHVETVSWIFQLLTILAASFLLISVNYFVNFVFFNKKKTYLLSLIFFLASLWTKSIAILFPFLFLTVLLFNLKSYKRLIFILPFFLISLLVGIINIEGANHHISDKKYELQSDEMFLNFSGVSNQLRSLFPRPERNKGPISKKYADDQSYYESVFGKPSERVKTIKLNFDRKAIFTSGLFHYPLKLILPFPLRFIYAHEKSMILSLTVGLVILMLSLWIIIKNYSRLFAAFSLVYAACSLGPFLGISFITFFYWSHVSDRYTYLFVVTLLVLISLALKHQKKVFVTGYALLLILLTLNQGLFFNTPIRLYQDALTQNKHPAIYSALFEEQILLQQFFEAEKTVNEGLKIFPAEQTLQSDKQRIEIYKRNFN